MGISLLTLNDFAELFSGNTMTRGVNNTSKEVDETGKRKSVNRTERGRVTSDNYKAHLEGKEGLGIVPIRENNTCSFSVIDVDVYNVDTTYLMNTIKRIGLPLMPFRSKSGGLHLYVFWSKPVKAKDAVERMSILRRILMLDKKTEIFPKQTFIKAEDSGSWINLPYFDAEHTERFMYGENNRPLPIDEALYVIRDNLQTKENFDALVASLPLNDAPPCLQAIYISGDTNNRNNYLFSLARYYKSKNGDDFEFNIVEANNLLKRPLDIEEIQRTIIATHKKKDYSYKCGEEPICNLCDKEICKARKYGIGGEEVSELSFGAFIQYMSDPPYYEWIINEKPLKFWSEADIIMQNAFRNQCFRFLSILPSRLSDRTWTRIVNEALKNIEKRVVEMDTDISPGSLFIEYLTEFLTSRAMAANREQILADRVYKDTEINAYVFRPRNLLVFLIQQKQFRYYGLAEIQDRMKSLGAYPLRYYIDKENKTARVWVIPFEAISKFIDAEVSDVAIDFSEERPDEQF